MVGFRKWCISVFFLGLPFCLVGFRICRNWGNADCNLLRCFWSVIAKQYTIQLWEALKGHQSKKMKWSIEGYLRVIQFSKGSVFGVSGCCSRGTLQKASFALLWFESVPNIYYLFLFFSLSRFLSEKALAVQGMTLMCTFITELIHTSAEKKLSF